MRNEGLKTLTQHWLLSERRFEEELNVIKVNHAFRGIAKDYKVELVEEKDLIEQLEASKSNIGDLLSNLLNETKENKTTRM